MARSHGLILLWNFVLLRQTEAGRQSVSIQSDRVFATNSSGAQVAAES